MSDLKAFPLLAEFGDDDRLALAELLESRSLNSGRSLFREGTEAEGLVLVVSGEVQLKSKRGSDLGSIGAGSAIGGLSLVVLGPRESTAIADGGCEILVLSRTAFRRLADDAPRTACRLLEAILDELAGVVRESLDGIAGSLGGGARRRS